MDKVMRETTARFESGKYSAPALSKGLDILELLAEEPRGFKKSEIAAALDITERTVKAHLSAIFDKLGVRDRVQLALAMNNIPTYTTVN